MFKEFRTFIMRGNVFDLAVGIIIGSAFGKIVTSFVNDIIMPPIGLLLGNVDFSNLFINLSSTPYSQLSQAQEAGAPTINYGLFINTVIDFIIVAFIIFLIIRWFNRLTRKEEPEVEEAPTTKQCPYCISEISIQASRCPYCTSALDTSASPS